MTRAIGVAGYVVLLASGYAYNLTFVQLGLTAFGRDRIGLSDAGVAVAMGGLAIATCGVALTAGWRMRGWSLRPKLRAAALAIAVQTALTASIGVVTTPVAFAGLACDRRACAGPRNPVDVRAGQRPRPGHDARLGGCGDHSGGVWRLDRDPG